LLRTALDAPSRRGRIALAECPFPLVLGQCSFDVHIAFTTAGKASAASSHTDLVAGSDWVRVMASTRQQPIRRGTVARTGFTSLDVGSGVSGSGTRSSLRGSASRELCYSATSEPSILGFLIKIIKPVGHYFVDAFPHRTQHPTM
jgi:hypothetical protein